MNADVSKRFEQVNKEVKLINNHASGVDTQLKDMQKRIELKMEQMAEMQAKGAVV